MLLQEESVTNIDQQKYEKAVTILSDIFKSLTLVESDVIEGSDKYDHFDIPLYKDAQKLLIDCNLINSQQCLKQV